jgi:hypothetical protein
LKGERRKMKKQLSLIAIGILILSMMAFLPNIANAYPPADYKTSIITAADRLVALQSSTDGGWDWYVNGLIAHTANPSAYNLYGVTALGLIDAYELTGNTAYLTAAKNTADFMKYGDPSIGDFYNGYDDYHWGYSYDYRFLMSYSAVSGDLSYKNYALDAWAWQKANKAAFTDGNQETLWAYYPDPGYAAWGTSDWGLATLRMGDTVWATSMATVMHNHMADILLSDPMAMGSTLRFLATIGGYAGDVTLLKEELVALQELDGSWEFPGYLYPCTQSTAYAVMGLWTAGEYTAARKGADWLVSTQGTLGALAGGWPQTDYEGLYDETSETDSEPLQALFTAMPATLYINPPSISKSPSDLNSFFDVYVDVDINDLFAFDIKITWDNTLITFSSFDKTPLTTIWPQGFFEPLGESGPVYQTGPGYFRYAAVATGQPGYTGTNHLFKLTFQIVKACNFELSTSIHFDTVKLSNSDADEITGIKTDGSYTMSATTPDLHFEFIDPNPSKPIEYCKTFQIEVNVTDCTNLNDYNLTIAYDSSLLNLTDVSWTDGVLGGGTDGASYTDSPVGTITIIDTGGITWTGTNGLLFTLTFHVEFNDDPGHIWRTNNLGPLHAFIKFNEATLSFVDPVGTITKSGINMPADLDIVVKLIQGDVNCDGKVGVEDLRTVAACYDELVPLGTEPHAKYDLKHDGAIDLYDLVKVATNFWYGY